MTISLSNIVPYSRLLRRVVCCATWYDVIVDYLYKVAAAAAVADDDDDQNDDIVDVTVTVVRVIAVLDLDDTMMMMMMMMMVLIHQRECVWLYGQPPPHEQYSGEYYW